MNDELYEAIDSVFESAEELVRRARRAWRVAARPIVSTAFVDPSSLSGLYVWLRADSNVTETANAVSSWIDKTSNQWDFVQATGSKQPTYTAANANFNNKPTITMAATGNKCLKSSSSSLVYGPFTVFFVAKTTTTSTYFYEHNAGGNYDYMWTDINGSIESKRTSGDTIKNISAGWGNNAAIRTITGYVDGTHANTNIRINGVDQSLTSAGPGTSPGATTLTAAMTIGGDISQLTASDMILAEFILYNRALSATEITDVEAYLKTRYAHY